jgi:hypothetical protein
MVISGKSVIRLVSKICLGKRGRKERKREAPAMLNMLPKLALVAIKTYFMVFAKRPSHKLCKPPERCKIESTDQEVLLWQEEIEIRNGKQSGKR